MTKMIPRVSTLSLILCLSSLTGCKVTEKIAEINTKPDTVNVRGIEKGAITTPLTTAPLISVEPNAISQPLFKIEPYAFFVPPEAVKFTIEQGAFQVQPGSVTINILSQKPPPIEIRQLTQIIKESLKPLGDISALPKEQQDRILTNEKVLQSVVKSLLDMVEHYNTNYAEFKAPPPIKPQN